MPTLVWNIRETFADERVKNMPVWSVSGLCVYLRRLVLSLIDASDINSRILFQNVSETFSDLQDLHTFAPLQTLLLLSSFVPFRKSRRCWI